MTGLSDSAFLTPGRIRGAAAVIDSAFTGTPLRPSALLSAHLGAPVWLKDETGTPIGSFKGRGVSWWMHEHPGVREIVCASAGNFGQAVAWSGTRTGRSVTVFAAETANPAKIDAMRRFGADVRLAGRDFDAAKAAARRHAGETGGFFLEDGLEPEIAEGAGTIGLECTDAAASNLPGPGARDAASSNLPGRGAAVPGVFGMVFIPVGNGALATGVASWFRVVSPSTRIVGVAAEGAPAMERSWRARRVVETERAETIADGIGVRIPVPESLPPLYGLLDEFLLVPDVAIIDAMRLLWRLEGLLTEPAGAVSLAGAVMLAGAGLPGAVRQGEPTLILLCGRNIDERYRSTWLEE